MNKYEFYKTSADYVKTSTDSVKVNKVRKIVNEVMIGKLPINEAVRKYNQVLTSDAHPMVESIRTKKVGQSLKEYYKNSLNDTDTAKMISSLVTHCIIESQVNESYQLSTDVVPLLDIVKEYVSNNVIDKSILNESLAKLGLNKEVIMHEER